MSEVPNPDTLTGVVQPEFDGMPEPPPNPFADVLAHTKATLLYVDEQITQLVGERERINQEVKVLREWKDRLERMMKIAEKKEGT